MNLDQYKILIPELRLAKYQSMTNQEAADNLNNVNIVKTKDTLSISDLLEVILENTSEYAALAAGDKKIVDLILGVGQDINISSTSKTKAALLSIFGAGTNIRNALTTKIQFQISRATELGLPEIKKGNIESARSRGNK